MVLAFYIKDQGSRLEVLPLGFHREVSHLWIFVVVAVVQVEVECHGEDGGAAQLTLAEAQLQVFHLAVEGQWAECHTVHIEYADHDGSLGLGLLVAGEGEAIEALVVAVHLFQGDMVVFLQVLDT